MEGENLINVFLLFVKMKWKLSVIENKEVYKNSLR